MHIDYQDEQKFVRRKLSLLLRRRVPNLPYGTDAPIEFIEHFFRSLRSHYILNKQYSKWNEDALLRASRKYDVHWETSMKFALSDDRRRPFRYLRQSRNRKQLDGDYFNPKFGIDILLRPHASFSPENPNPNLEIGTNSIAVFLHANTRDDLRIRICLGQRALQIISRNTIEDQVQDRYSAINSEFLRNRPQIYVPIIADAVNVSIGKSLFRGI